MPFLKTAAIVATGLISEKLTPNKTTGSAKSI